MEEDESTHRPTSKPLSVSSRLLVLRVNRPEANPPSPPPPPPTHTHGSNPTTTPRSRGSVTLPPPCTTIPNIRTPRAEGGGYIARHPPPTPFRSEVV